MTLAQKKCWNSIMPLHLRGKLRTRFCMFSKVRSADISSGDFPVYLNVYDLTPVNGYVYWAGLGIFHSGIEVHGVEYAFGAHDYPTSGVFEVEPRQCPGFKFRKSIFMGTTCLDPVQVREFMENESGNYNGDSYHLIVKNCNHFCKDICYKLTGNPVPKWVNRLARIGSLCHCLLPEALQVSAVRHEPSYKPFDGEKTRLRSSFSCLSSISTRQRHLSTSSHFLHSPLKGCLPPWDLRRSNNSSLKERVAEGFVNFIAKTFEMLSDWCIGEEQEMFLVGGVSPQNSNQNGNSASKLYQGKKETLKGWKKVKKKARKQAFGSKEKRQLATQMHQSRKGVTTSPQIIHGYFYKFGVFQRLPNQPSSDPIKNLI